MSPERTFTADHVIARSPWDVYEFLADPEQGDQWWDRHAVQLEITEEQPYTRIRFGATMEFELEPEGSGTRLTVRRTYSSRGTLGQIGLRFIGRGSTEQELRALLNRIEMALVYDAI
jgi:carbon monoxide dehydrogenase subunit G